MIRLLCLRLLLALGFVLGQSFALAHATQHELAPDDHSYCQTCAVAHAAGGIPAAAPVAVFFTPRAEEPAAPKPRAVISRPVSRPNSRGPPAFLV
jgi:hypothetical protein